MKRSTSFCSLVIMLSIFYALSVLANRESLEHSAYLSQSGGERGRPVRIYRNIIFSVIIL